MQIEYHSRFSKDLNKVRSPQTKSSIKEIINKTKSANSLKDIQNLKKLSGHRWFSRDSALRSQPTYGSFAGLCQFGLAQRCNRTP